MNDGLLVIARLISPLAGDAPHLDALLERQLSPFSPKAIPGEKIDRQFPAPPPANVRIPLRRRDVGGWPVAMASSPILSLPQYDGVEHFNKRFPVEHAAKLAPDRRVQVATTNGWTKSYRLPLRVRRVESVRWFAVADRREMLKVLRRVDAIGAKPSQGFGRVAEWTVERIDEDYSWFAPTDRGPMLMRPLPIGPWLPGNLVGHRDDFGACCGPYWHPDRYAEIATPC